MRLETRTKKKEWIILDILRTSLISSKKKKYNYKIVKKNFHINSNNPSSIFIIKKNNSKNTSKLKFIDPINGKNLTKLKNFYYCKDSCRLYPVFDGITIFSNNSGIFLPKPK